MKDALRAVAKWENRASPREALLFSPSGIDEAKFRDGRSCFIVGSKGAGKSAVIRHVEATKSPSDTFVENSFSPPLLYDFCSQTAGETIDGADLELLWTYFICSKVCTSLGESGAISGALKFDLDTKYGISNQRSWLQRFWRFVKGVKLDFKLKAIKAIDADIKVGLQAAIPQQRDGPGFLWAVHSEFAKTDAVKAVTRTQQAVYVTFDEIDVAFSQDRKRLRFEEYVSIVGALLSAVYKLRAYFEKANARIFPIVAIRSDIYNYITSADKTGWDERAQTLSFNTQKIREIVAHRLSLALEEGAPLAFGEAWRRVVNETQPNDPNSLFNYVQERTLNRPRDFVEFLKLASARQIAMRPARARITRGAFNQAGTSFSKFFLQEFRDEFSFRYDKPDYIIDVFKLLCPAPNANRFRFEAFVDACNKRGIEEGGRAQLIDLAKYLFLVSVLGVQIRGAGGNRFRYLEPTLQFPRDVDEDGVYFCLHTGLLKALFDTE